MVKSIIRMNRTTLVTLIILAPVLLLLFLASIIQDRAPQEITQDIHITNIQQIECVCNESETVQSSKIDTRKPFLYLIQLSKPINKETFKKLPEQDADIVYLTYNYIDKDTSIYLPKSTWTEGRNALYYHGLLREFKQGWKYKYFVLVDGDIRFSKEKSIVSQFESWHKFLLEWEPALASPTYHDQPHRLGEDIYTYGLVDAMFNAIHREVIDVLLPYSTYWDSKSWWASQAIMAVRANLLYRGHIMLYGGISGYNAEHTPYPQRPPFTQDVLSHAAKIQQCSESIINSTKCFPPMDELVIKPEKKNQDYSNPTCNSYMDMGEFITHQHGAYSFGVFCT